MPESQAKEADMAAAAFGDGGVCRGAAVVLPRHGRHHLRRHRRAAVRRVHHRRERPLQARRLHAVPSQRTVHHGGTGLELPLHHGRTGIHHAGSNEQTDDAPTEPDSAPMYRLCLHSFVVFHVPRLYENEVARVYDQLSSEMVSIS